MLSASQAGIAFDYSNGVEVNLPFTAYSNGALWLVCAGLGWGNNTYVYINGKEYFCGYNADTNAGCQSLVLLQAGDIVTSSAYRKAYFVEQK